MKIEIEWQGKRYLLDTGSQTDISIGVKRKGNVNAYYLSEPVFEPFRADGFTGSISEGGAVNCESISLYPHGNGTHTECVGHISDLPVNMLTLLPEPFLAAQLVSVSPSELSPGNHAITLDAFRDITVKDHVEALIVRTLPNNPAKVLANYSGTNPVYFTPEAIEWMKKNGIKHLLTDLPSVDPEVDGGKMLAHRAFFQFPDHTDEHATITELIFVPDTLADGLYALNLQTAPIETDAVPSRPVLFAVIEKP